MTVTTATDKRIAHLTQVLSEITYPFRQFVLRRLDPDALESRLYLQVQFEADGQLWRGRKWHLSQHATDAEVVQTALKAALTSAEHEVREHFLWRGRAVFGPHMDLHLLWKAAELEVHRTPEAAPVAAAAEEVTST